MYMTKKGKNERKNVRL